jgi:uncharacterized MAPEG superfamily protein
VAGNLAGLPASTLNTLTAGYVASRVLYNWAYINGTTALMGSLRSGVYMVGVGQILTLFIKAGNVFKDRAVY